MQHEEHPNPIASLPAGMAKPCCLPSQALSTTATGSGQSDLCLASFAADTARQPRHIRMYHRLLCVKANDKAYIPHTSDSVILPVVAYYQDKGDEKRFPEVYYYAGRVYRDLGNILQAMDYFEDALDAIHKQDTRHPLEVKVYSQLGTLYAYRQMYKEALDMYAECLLMHKANGDSVGMVFSLRDVGNMCRELHHSDKALRCYKEAKNIADGLGRTDLSRMLQSQLIGAYTDVQLYDSAWLALQEVLYYVERPNQSAVYSTAAYYYLAVGKKDSANFYYRKLLECGTVYAKDKAYRSLLSERVERFDDSQFSMLFNGMLECVDSLQTMSRETDKLQSYANYNYREKSRENIRLKELVYRSRRTIGIACVISAICLLALGVVLHNFRRVKKVQKKQQRKLLLLETEKQQRNDVLDSYRQQKVCLEEKLRGAAIKAGNSLQIKRQKEKIELINHILEENRVRNEKEMEAQQILFKSVLYGKLVQRAHSARGEAYVTAEEWNTLRILFDSAYPKFFEHLYFLCPPNDNELHVCILIRLSFSPADIARLLQLKPSTISSIRVRLYQKATGKKGKAESWDEIIMSL